ncbi:MAG: CBS domain-containing protein [Nanoarchaeota archaeon]|nr:CBS domain-containing protein [Nanoarchaeota archaeon]
MRTGFSVRDVMTRKVQSVVPNTCLQECAEIMAKSNIGSVLVIEKEKLLGLITEKDIVRKAVSKGKNPLKMKVKDIMAKKLITSDPNEDIHDAMDLMSKNQIRHLPVIEKGKLIGIVTMKDVIRVQPELFNLVLEKLDVQEERKKPIFKVSSSEGVCEICGTFSDKIRTIKGSLVCPNCKDEV